MENLNFIGETKGTELERLIKQNFNGEIMGAGIYMAVAFVCRNKNNEDMAKVFERMALDEAKHAGFYALLNGMVEEDILKQLESFLNSEQFGVQNNNQLLAKAKELGLDNAAKILAEANIDESKHIKTISELLHL